MGETIDSAGFSGKRILVVDDHHALALLIVRAIAVLAPGAEILSAQGGGEALELAANLPLDLLITDWVMPDMDGLELIGRLQSRPSGLLQSTILMTAYDVPGLNQLAADLHVDHVIIKPFPPDLLLEMVRGALDRVAPPTASSPE